MRRRVEVVSQGHVRDFTLDTGARKDEDRTVAGRGIIRARSAAGRWDALTQWLSWCGGPWRDRGSLAMRIFICRKTTENDCGLLQSELSGSQHAQIATLYAAEQKNLEELQHSSPRTRATLDDAPVNCAAARTTGAPRRAP